ncbi:alpha/beta hydrolase family protein [Rhodococcus erythropolis]|uniref:alpha/beta hydrolase family protein n=1 Tax=Rhodococcus erythropolis TaxID=1833 RepID=UPI000878BE38|nr:alpha/beta fold hydrolase [Rhodococcus erythropolis]OFV78167.1 alpha/beta hydrolase fold protein [Rhodococcus erythropolis]
MARYLAVALVCIFTLVISVASATGLDRDVPAVRIAYAAAADTFGDLYLPPGSDGDLPVVVLIHGGGWAQKSNLEYAGAWAKTLTPYGIAVWNIEYRRIGGQGGWPTTLSDTVAATNALAGIVQEKASGRLDLGRVHIAGYSAGGQLAAWVASRPQQDTDAPAPDLTVPIRSATIMAGVFDMTLAATAGKDRFVRNLLGGMPVDHPDRYRIASPIEHLPTGLPVTAIHGLGDKVVSVEQSRRYARAARAAGDVVDLIELPGVGHGEFGNPTTNAWAITKQAIIDHVNTP